MLHFLLFNYEKFHKGKIHLFYLTLISKPPFNLIVLCSFHSSQMPASGTKPKCLFPNDGHTNLNTNFH